MTIINKIKMHQFIVDEQDLWKLPPKQRLEECKNFLKMKKMNQ
jgi:hypothetical protein